MISPTGIDDRGMCLRRTFCSLLCVYMGQCVRDHEVNSERCSPREDNARYSFKLVASKCYCDEQTLSLLKHLHSL